MSSSVSNLQLLNNTEHRVKFKTGSDINNALNPLVGEMFLEKIGQADAISLDGTSKRDTNYTFGGGEFSFSAWFKTTKEQFIIATDSPAGGNDTSFAIGFKNGTTPYVLIGNPGQEVYQTSGSFNAINDNNWHNLIVTIDNSKNMKFYLDGSLEATHVLFELPGASDHLTHVGSGWLSAVSNGTWGVDGELKGLGIWEKALTDQQINTIFMSGMDSPIPYHFSPNLWLGPTGPSVYTCTDTSGAISKVSGNLKKMGDVPMLKIKQQQFAPAGTFTTHPNFAYSFWFYDDGVGTGEHFLIQNAPTGQNRIRVNHDISQLTLELHGNFDGPCDSNHGPNCAHFFDNSIVTTNGVNANLKYEKYKLNHLLVVKKAGTIGQTHTTGSCWIYLNGKLVASIIEASYLIYPSTTFLHKINHANTVQEMMLGDVAYWNEDVTGIVDEIFDPIGAHKGQQGNLMNLSIQPYHYWKLGFPMQGGEIKDIGSDGTNHLTPNAGVPDGYQYKNIFGIDRSTE